TEQQLIRADDRHVPWLLKGFHEIGEALVTDFNDRVPVDGYGECLQRAEVARLHVEVMLSVLQHGVAKLRNLVDHLKVRGTHVLQEVGMRQIRTAADKLNELHHLMGLSMRGCALRLRRSMRSESPAAPAVRMAWGWAKSAMVLCAPSPREA